jgi:hypothetical protein
MTCENLEKVDQKTVHGGMGIITATGFDGGGDEDSNNR